MFDPRSPRITAFHIHEWLYEQLQLREDDIRMIQVDGPRRRVYIKFVTSDKMQTVLTSTKGELEYRHENGEVSVVRVDIAGMGLRRVRVANLPPEVSDRVLRAAMSKYGDVKEITGEQWARQCRYPVSNGIRIVELQLKQHIPSHKLIVGQRVLITYEGQPTTCYGCNEAGHQYGACPHRKTATPPPQQSSQNDSWAQVVAKGSRATRQDEGPRERGEERGGPFDAHYNMDNSQPLDDGQQDSKQVLIQPTTQEDSQDTANKRDYAETEVPTEAMDMESGESPVPADEGEKDTAAGKQISTRPSAQTMGRDSYHGCMNSDTNVHDYDVPMAQETSAPSQTDVEEHEESPVMSPKRSKKLKTDRDTVHDRDRTRSRTRHKTPQKARDE
jgi:hypothetical protein